MIPVSQIPHNELCTLMLGIATAVDALEHRQ